MIVSKIIEWDMGHRIPNHRSKCKNLHGHRYRMELSLSGDLVQKQKESNEGMVIDFSDIKKMLESEILIPCDHSFMVADSDSIMTSFYKKHPELKHIIVPFIPTAEEIAKWCAEKINTRLKSKYKGSITIYSLTIWETPTSNVQYLGKDFIK